MSAAAARRLIAAREVRVDGRLVPKGAPVVAGAIVEITSETEGGALVLADATTAVTVIYQDDQMVAVDKPADLPSHPLRPGERRTAANAIVARFPECAAASPDPREGGLAHRLDTATSGVLIAARSRVTWHALRSALGAADCEKLYLCEVWGAPPDQGRIAADIGRRGRRGRVVRTDGGRHPRPAETVFKVIWRGPATALLEARLQAGRAHQVRAHLAAAGHPIVGDDRYGGDRESSGGLRLHARSVRLRHPLTGAELLIVAPLPPWASAEKVQGLGKFPPQ